MTKSIFVSTLLFFVLGFSSCKNLDRTPSAPLAAEIVRDELGDLRNSTTWGQITAGGQPSPEVLELAAKRGYTRVINLRSGPEVEALDFDEKALTESLGMEYHWFPVMWSQMDDDDYDAILAELERPIEGKTLLHCASGNRTSLFVAIERILNTGTPYEKALEDARMAGMKPSSVAPLDAQLKRLSK